VGVQAFETAGARACAADAEVQLGPQAPLLVGGALEACLELRILGGRVRPALDAARSLETGDLRDEVRTREPVRRRERVAAVVVRRLFADGGSAEGAADDDAPEGAGRPS